MKYPTYFKIMKSCVGYGQDRISTNMHFLMLYSRKPNKDTKGDILWRKMCCQACRQAF